MSAHPPAPHPELDNHHNALRCPHCMAQVRGLLREVVQFLEDEADNRAAAGSEMSDYEREPRDLAERLGALLP